MHFLGKYEQYIFGHLEHVTLNFVYYYHLICHQQWLVSLQYIRFIYLFLMHSFLWQQNKVHTKCINNRYVQACIGTIKSRISQSAMQWYQRYTDFIKMENSHYNRKKTLTFSIIWWKFTDFLLTWTEFLF